LEQWCEQSDQEKTVTQVDTEKDLAIRTVETRRRLDTIWRTFKYLSTRIVTIAITIFIGIFITVVLADQGGQIESSVRAEVLSKMADICGGCSFSYVAQDLPAEKQAEVNKLHDDLVAASGLNLPYWLRQARWTLKALALDWHESVRIPPAPGSVYSSLHAQDILLADLPHTLLLVGAAYLLLFTFGLPLSLLIFRRQGGWLDRLFSLLSPLSSIPSWVFGMLLLLVFANELHVLPFGGMYDSFSSATPWGRTGQILKHMLLPVLAILASLFFQYVYTWRTMFTLHADEDYVNLARAKGLPNKTLERRYILRPTLPFLITNFALVLITFWQMTIVLEKVVNWPGIGRLYILTLPNFFGEAMYPGVISITLGIVVIFAYMLGVTVLILDIAYAIVDPRIRIANEDLTVRPLVRRSPFRIRRHRAAQPSPPLANKPTAPPRRYSFPNPEAWFSSLGKSLKSLQAQIKPAWRELIHYPSAVVGLVLILILASGSLYAVIAYPYNRLGQLWYTSSLSGKIYTPKIAMPEWTNWFRKDKLPPSLVLDSRAGTAERTVQAGNGGSTETGITYRFNYPYAGFPQDIILYFYTRQGAKPIVVFMTLTTPDGRTIDLGRAAAVSGKYFDVLHDFSGQQLRASNKLWRKWTGADLKDTPAPSVSQMDPLPGLYFLFANPISATPEAVRGTYTLHLKGVGFESDADLNAELVLLGQVYGAAGTDNMGRDLLVPLFWGMPFALIFGLLGALVTTVLSMGVAAVSVWFGGPVDNFIQRLVEANMILPVIAIGVLIYSYFNVSIWIFLGIIVLLNVFGSPTKTFRAAFLQIKDSPYLEAARVYGASNLRIITRYLVPRMTPILIPQLAILIPSYVFLEATLGFFNIKSNYPTWGRIIYEALNHGSNYGSSFWVLEPLALLLFTAVAFALMGFGLERILNPRMRGS
jgi:peptide/nickel transport system permease protein